MALRQVLRHVLGALLLLMLLLMRESLSNGSQRLAVGRTSRLCVSITYVGDPWQRTNGWLPVATQQKSHQPHQQHQNHNQNQSNTHSNKTLLVVRHVSSVHRRVSKIDWKASSIRRPLAVRRRNGILRVNFMKQNSL